MTRAEILLINAIEKLYEEYGCSEESMERVCFKELGMTVEEYNKYVLEEEYF